MRDNTRVVITGIGIISSIGFGKDGFWDAAISGKCGASAIESFDTSPYKVHRACEVKGFNYGNFTAAPLNNDDGRATQFAVTAIGMALDDASFPLGMTDPTRVGIALGTASGEIQIGERILETLAHDEKCEIDRGCYARFPIDSIAASAAKIYNLEGPIFIFPTACAAGNYAIGYACDMIKAAGADMMIAGGVDPFSKIAFTGFCRLNAIAPDLCRPFDKNRRGFLLGEGAGFIVLERRDYAIARGARIYAEILGYGNSCDSYHVTAPDPSAKGMVAAMHEALDDAEIVPDDVDYINAHGTGTPSNDKIETLAIKTLFKDHANRVAISSTKSMIGHTLGAASAIEAITCALAVYHDAVPPTINLEVVDPELNLDYVANIKREMPVSIAMNNAFAFGGNNTSLVISKHDDRHIDRKLRER